MAEHLMLRQQWNDWTEPSEVTELGEGGGALVTNSGSSTARGRLEGQAFTKPLTFPLRPIFTTHMAPLSLVEQSVREASEEMALQVEVEEESHVADIHSVTTKEICPARTDISV